MGTRVPPVSRDHRRRCSYLQYMYILFTYLPYLPTLKQGGVYPAFVMLLVPDVVILLEWLSLRASGGTRTCCGATFSVQIHVQYFALGAFALAFPIRSMNPLSLLVLYAAPVPKLSRH